jgi:hypothetical protein
MIGFIIGMIVGGTIMVFYMKKDNKLSVQEIIDINDFLNKEAIDNNLTVFEKSISKNICELESVCGENTFYKKYCTNEIIAHCNFLQLKMEDKDGK